MGLFSVKGNSVFLFANGSMCKIPRCNVQLWKGSEEDEEEARAERDQEEGKVFEKEAAKVQFEETEEEEKGDEGETERRVTGSMTMEERKELQTDQISALWLQ